MICRSYFYEGKENIVVTCQGRPWSVKVDDLCQVYETMEVMLLNPEEVVKAMKQADDANTPGSASKHSSFLKLGLNFGIKDRNQKRASPRCENSSEETPVKQPFSNFFEGKSSLFSKNKPPKPGGASSPGDKTPSADENDWTLI